MSNIGSENNLSPNINNVTEEHNTLTSSSDTVSYKTSLANDEKCQCSTDIDIAKKTEQLKNCLEENIHSCDITWSLFQSALNSYRFDTCLRPFPTMFMNNGYKDATRMKTISKLIPDMYTLKETIDNGNYTQDVIHLLHWVLVNQRDPYLKIIIDPDVSDVYKHISEKQLSIPPNHIFEVVYSKQQEEQFQKRKQNKNDSIYAFHGSRLDNFYSILKFGLQQHMSCNETLFGAGIYLSSELLLSLAYAPGGSSWDKSCFGSNYSIVALCEIINDTENVKCQDVTDKKRSINPGSIGGSVPYNYYVVLNNDLVRVRYLLIYEQNSSSIKIKNKVHRKSKLYEFFKQNKMIIMLTLYSLLLCFIGFLNSSFWYKIRRSISNYFEDEFL